MELGVHIGKNEKPTTPNPFRKIIADPESEMSLESLKNGECTEIDWNKPCPICGTQSEKLVRDEPTNTIRCLYDSCLGIQMNTDPIKYLSIVLMDKKDAEDGLIETIHSIKTMAILAVESDWEASHDKALSNATKRNVEVELRLSGDDEYVMRVDQQIALHREIRRDQIELDFQQREFQRQNGNVSITLALDSVVDTLKGIDETLALGFVAEKVAEMDAQMRE